MQQKTRIALAVVIAFVVGGQVAQANWFFHNRESLFFADKNNQKHPKKATLILVMSADTGSVAELCSGYSNSMNKGNKGKIVITVEIDRMSGVVEELKFNGRVRDNGYSDCKAVSRLVAGDIIVFHFKFKSLPVLKSNDEGLDGFIAGGGVFDIFGVSSAATTAGSRLLPRWLDSQ